MHPIESQYLDTLMRLVSGGPSTSTESTGRNGAEVVRLITPPRLDWICEPHDGFPLLLSKRVAWKAAVAEFCWMMQGRTDLATLDAWGAGHIWRPWALPDGTIGKAYGYQIEHPMMGHQIGLAIEELKRDPSSRRACWTHWRGNEIPDMALPPCHGCFCQLRVVAGKVHLHMHQRSADWCVGVPLNIVFYSLLLRCSARLIGRPEGGLHIAFGDVHMYEAHRGGATEQVARRLAVNGIVARPRVQLTRPASDSAAVWLRTLEPGDFALSDYEPMEAIKFEVAV